MVRDIGIIIQELRKQRNMNQSELAELLHVSQRTVSNYEQGFTQPSLETINRIADIFNVRTDVVFGRERIPAYPRCQLDMTGQLFLKHLKEQAEKLYIEHHQDHVVKAGK